VKFSTHEEFQLKAHECFGRIFELLMKVDETVKKGADEEEARGHLGEMSDLRDWVEEIVLQCHLAWQYHRLSKGPQSIDTWDQLQNAEKQQSSRQDGGRSNR
jgi:hypothetical protein